MNNKTKIAENPTSAKLLNDVKSFTMLFKILRFIPGIKRIFPDFNKLLSQLEELEQQTEILFIPDKFNEKLGDLGWIAYESLNLETMKKAISLVENNEIEAAETYLADYYGENNLKWLIMRFQGHKEFRRRLRLVELAKEDYLAKRYHAFIPLILSITDGLVRDVSNHVGLFGESVNLTLDDSIAAHESGLQKLIKLIGRGRGKTNDEPITIPYRHGILHGRELAFDNKIVAAKCWSTLFAVRDWAQAIAEKKSQSEEKEKKSWLELWKMLQETQAFRQRIENWQGRTWLKDFDWSNHSASEQLDDNSPEKSVALLFETWKKCQWGKFAEFIVDYSGTSIKKKAGELRKDFEHIKILDFKLLEVVDESSAFSKIKVKVNYEYQSNVKTQILELNPVYQDYESSVLSRTESGGKWKIHQRDFGVLIYDNKK